MRKPISSFIYKLLLTGFLIFSTAAFAGNDLTKSFTRPGSGFIQNKGQIIDQNYNPNPSVLYLLPTPGLNVQLRRGGFSYDAYRITNYDFPPRLQERGPGGEVLLPRLQERGPGGEVQFHRIDINLIGFNPDYTTETGPASSDYYNYYTTGTPDEGITRVKSFEKVTYRSIYPGIDLEFIADPDGYFEYNFILRPGADLNAIKLKVRGPERIKKFRDGLTYETNIGEIDESVPVCFYRINGLQVPVKGRFYRIDKGLYGFRLDRKIPEGAVLTIDPVPTRRWGTYYCAYTGVKSCAVDGLGNIVITGTTGCPNNVATAGAYQGTLQGISDAMIVKFDTDGNRIWGTYYGGSSSENGFSVAVDKSNNIVICGSTGSTNNIASPGAYQTLMCGTGDGFIAKFTPDGMRIWGTYYGGHETPGPMRVDYLETCSVDTSDNIYCSGFTNSPDGIASPGAHQTVFGGVRDDYLVKFSGDGQRLWGTYYGGSFMEQNSYCTATKNGYSFLTGNTISPNNIATPGSFAPTFPGINQGFLAAFDQAGQRLWGTYFAGQESDVTYGCTADTSTDVYIFGNGSSPNIGTPGAFQDTTIPVIPGSNGAYLSKFNIAGQYLWGTFYGACGNGTGGRILGSAVDDSGFVYVTGWTNYQDSLISIIAPPGAWQTQIRGFSDPFLAKFTSNGQQRIWGTYYGGTGQEDALSCAVDKNDNIYLCGITFSENNTNNDTSLCTRPWDANYIATPYSHQSELGGGMNLFLVKFADCYSPDTALLISGPPEVCASTNGITYSIDPIFASENYNWCATGTLGIASGQNSTSITVNVGPVAGKDTISVYGINSCDKGFPKLLFITVKQRPVPVIISNDTACTGDTVLFTTAGGMTNYSWIVSPGGIVISGGSITDSSVSVKWTTGGTQWVKVSYDSIGCETLIPTQKDIWIVAGPQASVTISPSANPVCAGTMVTFTAIPVNEGVSPVFQWRVNGINAGTNNPVFSYVPMDLDIVSCILVSSVPCASNSPDTSNSILMVIGSNLLVSVSISASANPVCEGTSVTYTATPVNGGTTPVFQWYVDGIPVGTNSPVFTYIPSNGNSVSCLLTSDYLCATNNPAISNSILMVIDSNLLVSVSISASANPACEGTSVTYTAIPVNGGATPVFQWKVNGVNVGTNSPVFTYNPVSSDLVSCILTSSETACITNNPATSNTILMVIDSNLLVGVSISASANSVCEGTSVTYTATPVNGGTVPSYQWKVNGVNMGANNFQFAYIPVTGDQVTCVLTSNANCASGNPATSNTITMIVNPNIPVSVSISASEDTVCAGTSVTFTASPVNGGIAPVFQWYVNGIPIGTNSPVYTYNPVSSDLVSCILTSSETVCVTNNPVTSNQIIMTVSPNLPVSISIAASANPVCEGTSVTYTATPVNGGTAPVFQWYVNGIPAGTNSPVFTYIPSNGNSVSCLLTSNSPCTTNNPATSNPIVMNIVAKPVTTFTACFDTITTVNAKPIKLKGGIPLGGIYSGPGVNTGIFYPAIAGAGSHVITYTYTNAGSCSDNAQLSIVNYPLSIINCGLPITDIRDNKVYPTVQIGTQCWLASNLNYGSTVPSSQYQRDNCIPEKYCYNDIPANCQLPTANSYYQWDELMAYDTTPGNQGLCPPAWHVPTEAEWNTLFANYINNGFAGSPLKYSGYSGFNALLTGAMHFNKAWNYSGFAAFFWSSTSWGTTKAWAHGMNDPDPSVSRYPSYRTNAFSVRCVKD